VTDVTKKGVVGYLLAPSKTDNSPQIGGLTGVQNQMDNALLN
jgi:hypothetical protein